MTRLGLPVIDVHASERVRVQQELALERAHQGGYNRMPLLKMCQEALRLNGHPTSANPEETMRAAISTGTAADIFTTVIETQLIDGYKAAPDSTKQWTSETDVESFQQQDRPRLGHTAAMEMLPRGGSASFASLQASKENYVVRRFAKQVIIDDQDIIDDRVGAFKNVPRELGVAAAQVRPDLVYAILLANAALAADNIALFDAADHVNLDTGAGLAAATLEAAMGAVGIQQDVINLNQTARFLITPQGLKRTALGLLHDLEVSGGDENIIPICEARLDNGVTDPASGTLYAGSATTWYMSIDPSRGPTIEVAYLSDNNRQPVITPYPVEQGRWGIGWAVNIDIGAKALGYQGVHKATA